MLKKIVMFIMRGCDLQKMSTIPRLVASIARWSAWVPSRALMVSVEARVAWAIAIILRKIINYLFVLLILDLCMAFG